MSATVTGPDSPPEECGLSRARARSRPRQGGARHLPRVPRRTDNPCSRPVSGTTHPHPYDSGRGEIRVNAIDQVSPEIKRGPERGCTDGLSAVRGYFGLDLRPITHSELDQSCSHDSQTKFINTTPLLTSRSCSYPQESSHSGQGSIAALSRHTRARSLTILPICRGSALQTIPHSIECPRYSRRIHPIRDTDCENVALLTDPIGTEVDR